MCMHEWQDLQFNVDSERQIFEKLFMAIFIYSSNSGQKSAERKSPDVWPGIRTILDYDDFIYEGLETRKKV